MQNDIIQEIRELYSLQRFGIKLGLENITEFLNRLGNPQNRFKVIHIAGSNGKGSTSSYIASILMEEGYKTGLYTSPHFVRFNERVSINGQYVPDEYIIGFMKQHRDYIFERKLTFFEATTALAFDYFAAEAVDYAVIETGLGGRLDATNVVDPIAVVITSISMEHTEQLGDKVEMIASEKAAIIKPGVKAFIGRLPQEAVSVICRRCDEVGAELFELDDYIIEREQYIELYTEELDIDKLDSPLFGKYQRRNAALAILAVYGSIAIVNPHVFERGISNVIKNTRIQGRFEYYRKKPTVIMDSAHNPEGLQHFISAFNSIRPGFSRTQILFTALKDKAIVEMIDIIRDSFDVINVTTLDIDRAYLLDEIESVFLSQNISVEKIIDPREKVKQFLETASPDECLVITGSMYLLGYIKEGIENQFV